MAELTAVGREAGGTAPLEAAESLGREVGEPEDEPAAVVGGTLDPFIVAGSVG